MRVLRLRASISLHVALLCARAATVNATVPTASPQQGECTNSGIPRDVTVVADILVQDLHSENAITLLQKRGQALASKNSSHIVGQMLQDADEIVHKSNSTLPNMEKTCCNKYNWLTTWRVQTSRNGLYGVFTTEEFQELRNRADSYIQLFGFGTSKHEGIGRIRPYISKLVVRTSSVCMMILLLKTSDVVVLLPSFAAPSKFKLGAFYVVVMCALWLACWITVEALDRLEKQDVNYVQPMLRMGSLALVAVMAIKLFTDWLYGKTDELVERAEEAARIAERRNVANRESRAKKRPAHVDEDIDDRSEEPTSVWNFFWLCISTNMDKIGTFIPSMQHNLITPLEFFLGNLVAAVIVAVLMVSLGKIEYVRHICRRVPTFVILVCLLLYLVVAEIRRIEEACHVACAAPRVITQPGQPNHMRI